MKKQIATLPVDIRSLEKQANMSGVEILKKVVDKNPDMAFLCEINPHNPYYLKIIHFNQKFAARFKLKEKQILGNNYDFLFDDLDLGTISENQSEYAKLLRAVKDFKSTIVKIDINNPHDPTLTESFKITFSPNHFKSKFRYSIFTFEDFDEDNFGAERDFNPIASYNAVIRNLERNLRNERFLRKVSDLVTSGLSLKEMAKQIAKSICLHLKVDRCILHDCHDGRTGFLSEHHDEFTKSIIGSNKRAENNTTPIKRYINMHHYLFSTVNDGSSEAATILSEDTGHDPRFLKIEDICLDFGIKSQISVITTFDNKINGGFYVHQSSPRRWLIEELELIEMVAKQFAMAIERQALIDKRESTNQQLSDKTNELMRALREEKRMRKMQSKFVAIVSHEFKTPLQIIDSTREILLRKMKSEDPIVSKYLERIKAGITRMNGLIQSTLNLSRIEMNKSSFALHRENFRVKNLVQDVVERSHNLAVDKNIKILVEIDELPEFFNGDSKLLDHCLSNIITNAIKYSRDNSLIKVLGKIENQNMIIKAIDCGMGIPAEDLEHICKKFFRAKNTLSVAGTGIGLYLTKYFVELHKGSVLINSKIGVGTAVSLALPLIETSN